MKIPQLDITYYKSNIIIEQTDPKMRISGQVGDFSLEKQERQFEINQTKPKLTIDNYPAQKQLHHLKPDDLRVEISQKAQQNYMESLSERVQNGDILLNIQNKEVNAFKEIAKNRVNEKNEVSLSLEYFPQNPIEIDVKLGEISIEYSPEKIKTNVEKTLQIDFERGEVKTKIDQYPKVEIDVVGENIDYLI